MEVVQEVLLFGSETWVMSPHIGRMLGGFYHRVICQLKGQNPRQKLGDILVYPSFDTVVVEAGLDWVEMYVTRRQNTVTQFVANRPIVGLFLEV